MAQINYKFNEKELIKEFQEYIDSTYSGHYSKDNFQATEFIIDGGHGTGFCIGNVLKYAQRYGKKGMASDARKDLMKVLHYALIQLYVHDVEEDLPLFVRTWIHSTLKVSNVLSLKVSYTLSLWYSQVSKSTYDKWS